MKISGWGGYPTIDTREIVPRSISDISLEQNRPLIPRGNGRSYGDSANATTTLDCRHIDHFISFNKQNGILTVQSGATLREILNVIVPYGWFLPVTPGTSHVTLGGAIAADVHGKNHHTAGSLGNHIVSMKMMLGDGSVLTVSSTQHSDLYHATCGGMGLTGIILEATIKLTPIHSTFIRQSTLKLSSLEETFDAFEEYHDSTYSVAWIDCLKTGKELGRSVLMTGEHAEEHAEHSLSSLNADTQKAITIPFHTPGVFLNKWSMSAFNNIYYAKANHEKNTLTPLMQYFYPLDAIGDWNKLYGRKGFVQYQFVIPEANALNQMKSILERITDSGKGSFLAVLKKLGAQNKNLLSFPMSGYTLALDFKYNNKTVELLSELDKMIVDYDGRIYLAKDAVMSEQTFKSSYQNWEEFENIRHKYNAIGAFSSQQSTRLGLA